MSYHDIVHGMCFKRLMGLRDARVKQLVEDAKRTEEEMNSREHERFKNDIMRK